MPTKDRLKRDPEVIVIGETSDKELWGAKDVIKSGEPTVTHAYADLALYRQGELVASGLPHTKPAMYEVCVNIIRNDAKARLPRGMDQHISNPRRNGGFTYESPRTYQF